jgi:hypothetical protein
MSPRKRAHRGKIGSLTKELRLIREQLEATMKWAKDEGMAEEVAALFYDVAHGRVPTNDEDLLSSEAV